MSSDTAHRAWDQRWATAEGRADWLEPEPEVRDSVALLHERGVRRVLDLGCGVGRHALHLADAGFAVTALDASPTGLGHARVAAAQAGLALPGVLGAMVRLPFAAGAFDAVLSWNVIYHGLPDVVRTAVDEIARVLAPGGVFLGTMLSTREANCGVGRELAHHTWVRDDHDEKSHPHFYADLADLAGLFAGFQVRRLTHREHKRPGSYHWQLLAERL